MCHCWGEGTAENANFLVQNCPKLSKIVKIELENGRNRGLCTALKRPLKRRTPPGGLSRRGGALHGSLISCVEQSAAAPLICTRRKRTCEIVRSGGVEEVVEGLTDGGEAGLAHLNNAAATGSAAPRPKRSPHLICPILRGGREEYSQYRALRKQDFGDGSPFLSDSNSPLHGEFSY